MSNSQANDLLFKQFYDDLSSIDITSLEDEEEEENENVFVIHKSSAHNHASTEKENILEEGKTNQLIFENDPDWIMLNMGVKELGNFLQLDGLLMTERQERKEETEKNLSELSPSQFLPPASFTFEPISIPSLPLQLLHGHRAEAEVSKKTTDSEDEEKHSLEVIELMESLIESIEYLALFDQNLEIARLEAQSAKVTIIPAEVALPDERLVLTAPTLPETVEEMIPLNTSRSVSAFESESDILKQRQYESKQNIQELENAYELRLRDEHIRMKKQREEEIKELEERKRKRLELYLKAQRENKTIVIQKYFRRYFQRKHYLVWKRQQHLKAEELFKQIESQKQQEELRRMSHEEYFSKSYQKQMKLWEEHQKQLLLLQNKSSKHIQRYYRGYITRTKTKPRIQEQKERNLMSIEDQYSATTIARLPVKKKLFGLQNRSLLDEEEDDCELIFLEDNNPIKITRQQFWFNKYSYNQLKSTDAERKTLVENAIISKRVCFPYFSSNSVVIPVTPALPKMKNIERKTKEKSGSILLLNALHNWSITMRTFTSVKGSSGDGATILESMLPHSFHPVVEFQQYYLSEQRRLFNRKKEYNKHKNELDSNEELSMIESLDLAVEGLTNLNFLSQYPAIQRLVLNVNQIQSLESLSSFQLPFLQFFSISDNQLYDITSLNSLQFQSLLSLNLDSNRLQYLDCHYLSSLHYFSANCNQLKSFPILSSKYLSKLELYNNAITSITYKEVLNLPSLLYLNLGKNQIHQFDDKWFYYCPLLQTLILSQNQLTRFLCPLQLPCLLALWLNGNQISEIMPSNLSDLSSSSTIESKIFAPQLKKLYLQDNRLTSLLNRTSSSSSSSINHIFHQFPLLLEADVSFNQFAHLDDLTPLTSCRFITNLKFNDNPICQRPQPNSVIIDAPITVKQVIEWCKESFPFLTSLNGETLTKEMTRKAYDRQSDGKVKQREYEQLLQLLQQFKAEYDDSMFRIRKKGLKKLPPLEESLQQLQNDVSLVYLAFSQKERLMSFLRCEDGNSLNVQESISSLENLLVYKAPPPPVTVSASGGATASNSSVSAFLPTPEFSSKTLVRLLETSINEVKATEKRKEQDALQREQDQLRSAQKQQQQKVAKNITKLQACYRGYRMRKKVRQYLNTIAYDDDELDQILRSGGKGTEKSVGGFEDNEDIFDLSDLLQMEEELELTATNNKPKHPQISSSLKSTSFDSAAQKKPDLPPLVPSIAYGDHIRKRNNVTVGEITSQNDNVLQNMPANYPTNAQAGIATPRSVHSTASSAKTISEADMSRVSSLPSSASAMAAAYHHATTNSEFPYKSPRQLKEATAVADDWGIVDPKVLATLMKRNHRIKNFLHAKENREKDKDSGVRYQKFLKQQAKGPASSITHRGNAGRGIKRLGRNGKGVRDHVQIPAWMAGGAGAGDEHDGEEEENDDEDGYEDH